MNKIIFCPASGTGAIRFACQALRCSGWDITDTPGPNVTHLLLPVPAFEADGRIKGGGILEHILADLPENITVIGGGLRHPALEGYPKMDLLEDGQYLAKNAAITADCAMRIAGQHIHVVFSGCPVLVIGWGRIGKCLASYLQSAGAKVTVAARKPEDRHMAQALGYAAEDPKNMHYSLAAFRILFNTAPATVLRQSQLAFCRRDCVKIDLASRKGLDSGDVLWERGLPGRIAPESSGLLIARSIIRMIAEKEAVQ